MIRRKKNSSKKIKYRAGLNLTEGIENYSSNNPSIPYRQLILHNKNKKRLDTEFQCFGCESGPEFGYHCPACERESDLTMRR